MDKEYHTTNNVPFVLHAGSINTFRVGDDSKNSAETRRRYAEIFLDIEKLIENQISLQRNGDPNSGRLRQLLPSTGVFFTKLPLERAFYVQDDKRSISKRRLVSPSFNDIRLILNTAQAMSLSHSKAPVQLVTFDGDVTLYEDGMSLEKENPIIPELLNLLSRGIQVGIVTAAGYSERSGEKYAQRLKGLLEAIMETDSLDSNQKSRLYIMGGEANYLFKLNGQSGNLEWIEHDTWQLPEMEEWSNEEINRLLNIAQSVLTTMKSRMSLPATIIRKERGVGLVPLPGQSMCREELEEVVLNAQKTLEQTEVGNNIQFCAFNGGSDVWVDIGDKRLGVMSLQRYLGGITGDRTLHVGDQFASIGANDFKARLAACTVWIASPNETVNIIRELIQYLDESAIFH